MNRATRNLFILALIVSAMAVRAAGWFRQRVEAKSPFYPACFEPGNPPRLRLFPTDGPEVKVALPAELPMHARVLTFGPDGRALYAQKGEPLNRSVGIYKVELQPDRVSVITGSVGMGEVRCLAVSESQGTVIVEGWSWSQNTRAVFEIDPVSGTMKALPAGSPSQCGGAGGIISPEGKRAITKSGKQLDLVDLKSGKVSVLKGTSTDTQCAWSPDGRWIAAVRSGRISLIDPHNTVRSRKLGTAGDGSVVWSPDSKYLSLRRSPLSCTLTFYGESLEVVEVETGRRELIKSSHCTITAGTLGWLDRRLAP